MALSIVDSGPGVPENLVDQIFEPFFRPDASRSSETGGSGLGLAIVRTCVESCGGKVSAANLNPVGFQVTITMNPSDSPMIKKEN